MRFLLLLYASLCFSLSVCDTFTLTPSRLMLHKTDDKVHSTIKGNRFKPFPHRGSSLGSIISTNILEPPVIRYLEKELQVSNDVLRKIILRFPWILYLQVTTNLKPTIEVFHAFGFKICEIRNIVSHAPSVLAINYQWTLPEKLISIQKMFHLSQEGLVRVIVSQPYLLTSSIERNYRTANFLSNVAQFNELEVQRLVTTDPRVAMCSVSVLQRCWSILTKLYGIPAAKARALILRYPLLLSSKLMKNIKERLIAFSSELQVESFPSEFVQALAHRFPPILYIDTAVFMKPNLDILKELLSTKFAGAEALGSVKYKRIYELLRPVRNEDQRIATRFNRTELVQAARHMLEDSVLHNVVLLVKTFPQLLAYNPLKLRLMCANALHFLTGERLVDFASSVLPVELCTQQSPKGDYVVQDDTEAGDDDQSHLLSRVDFQGTDASSGAELDDTDIVTDSVDEGDVSADLVEEWFHASALDPSLAQLDLIADIVRPSQRTETSVFSAPTATTNTAIPDEGLNTSILAQALLVYARQGGSLSLDTTRAVHILRTAPWILSYRTARSQRVLAALAVSLGMSNAELSKCVGTYPRLLSLSIDGKLSDVLRTIATFAAAFLTQKSVASGSRTTSTSEIPGVVQDILSVGRLDRANASFHVTQAIAAYRADAVRTQVREVIMRYPLILGTNLHRVQQRFASAAAGGLCWDDYLKLLRWPDARHAAFLRTWQPKVPLSQSSSSHHVFTSSESGVPTNHCDTGVHSPAQSALVEGAPSGSLSAAGNTSTISNNVAAAAKSVHPPARRRKRHAATTKYSIDGNSDIHNNTSKDAMLVCVKDVRIFEPYPDALKLRSMFANQRRIVQRSAFKVLKEMLPF